ncbi:Pectinesterase 3 [Glycine soja]|uniref:Pectinesterase 3 n=1 Tax=Glycine soja TaxID=3848 RepID=A0A445LFT2_GLYSO|nr:Pectinesterase 3 [Glycine soja]
MDDDSKEKERLTFNIAIMVASMIAIAMVTVSVVAHTDGPKQDAGKNVKTLLSVCSKTEDPESCFRMLKHVGEKATVLKAAINATLTEFYEVLGYSLKVPVLLTRIALSIVHNFSERPNRREARLMLEEFPRWFPATERKMIESNQGDNGGGEQWPINVVVAQYGRRHLSTIADSVLNACPKNKTIACVIYVKRGKYEKRVVIPKGVNQVFMYGDGPAHTIVTDSNTRDPKTLTTSFRAATFVVMGKGFICKDMGFTAPADIGGAPTLLVLSDHSAFFNCKIDGNEGTLLAVAQRQFYRDCEILGRVTQNSHIIVKPRNSSDLVLRRNVVSAQSRLDKHQTTGLVIQNYTITAHGQNMNTLNATTYLRSPYSEYSRTIIMESFIGDVIHPKGWCKWSDNAIETRTDKRVKWNGYSTIFERDQMVSYTVGRFVQTDQWLLNRGIPYEIGFLVQN